MQAVRLYAQRRPACAGSTQPAPLNFRIDSLTARRASIRLAMGSVITVRDIDPGDKAWLRQEARHVGLSMEEYVRRLIHQKRDR